ncbi:hypothetical protein BZG34_08830 [Neisseria gonorrhoeae]|nr:hypothetical protein BZG33_08805 [Neisseria gonorrhoeae]ASQ74068.1 hypothetical protein BZG34_08830 [Neisseria gonorrhoeae]GFL70943.1 hypothetical protein TUM15780_18520 [Neisseria gonorrhoeae]GFL72835.1 hypothetical protein TUM15781_16490 [Neisseria gonorrhoeae]GFL81023.1 hypothetical protein TUM15785_17050 [Neisseria gonorrhoeae]
MFLNIKCVQVRIRWYLPPGMAATVLHDGSATVMAATMTASASCGIALLWLCSHRAWKENGQSEYL